MFTLVTVIHISVALLLIVFVMLQDSKGGGAFGIGGGASAQTIFGSSGAGNFLVTATKWLAIMFAVTSIGLSYMSRKTGTSAMEGYVAPAATEAPAKDAVPTTENKTDAKSEESKPEQKK